jgi:hypothetical protein
MLKTDIRIYIYINRSFKVSDEAAIAFVKSTELPLNSSDLSHLNYHVWKGLKQIIQKKTRRTV